MAGPRLDRPSQFNNPGISAADAMSICGPVAAVAFARANGRNPTITEAIELAKAVGWTQERGMAGPESQRVLMEKLGVKARLDQSNDWQAVAKHVAAGDPVTVSTANHYFVIDDFDPQSGRYRVGTSGTDMRLGKEWMTAEEINQVGGGVNGMLYLSEPLKNKGKPAETASSVERFGGARPTSSSTGDATLPDDFDPEKVAGDVAAGFRRDQEAAREKARKDAEDDAWRKQLALQSSMLDARRARDPELPYTDINQPSSLLPSFRLPRLSEE